jgi:flagellin
MVESINTNPGANLGIRQLNKTSSILDRVRERVATGKEVNGPRDDAATFAIAQALSGEVAGSTAVQGALSAGQATVGVAITAGQSVSDQLVKLKSIAVQASQEGLDANSRQALQTEFDSLVEQINSTVSSAGFNGNNLVESGASGLDVLSGTDGATISVPAGDLSSSGLGIDGLSLGSAADAQAALNAVDSAIGQTSQTLATFGSSAQRIESQSDFTTTITNSLREGIGNLVDANLAEQSAILQAQEVRQRLGTQALSIANARPASIRALFE